MEAETAADLRKGVSGVRSPLLKSADVAVSRVAQWPRDALTWSMVWIAYYRRARSSPARPEVSGTFSGPYSGLGWSFHIFNHYLEMPKIT